MLQAAILLAILLTGCSAMPTEDIRATNAAHLRLLEPGMSRQEVLDTMGTGTAVVREGVYYEQQLVGYIDLTVPNPYRSETIDVDGERFEILYYYARPRGMGIGYWDTHFADRTVPDWFLTPLVLKNGLLLGWGEQAMRSAGLAKFPEASVQDEWLTVGS